MALDPRILVSLHGSRLGLTRGGHLVEDNHIMIPSWRDRIARSVLLDGFNGPVMDANKWAVNKGSDGSAANFAISVAKGGMLRATTGAGAGATYAVNGVQLQSSLNWEADQGGLEAAFSVKAAAITTLAMYVGFTDQTAALEMPFTLSAGTLTSNCTDGFGLLFDTAATAATWKAVSVANDVDGTVTDTGIAPVAATYDLIQVESDALGNVTFYLNGNPVAQNALGVTANIPLVPVVCAFRRSAASTTIDVDAIYCAQDRTLS